jgi:hypothetical protein
LLLSNKPAEFHASDLFRLPLLAQMRANPDDLVVRFVNKFRREVRLSRVPLGRVCNVLSCLLQNSAPKTAEACRTALESQDFVTMLETRALAALSEYKQTITDKFAKKRGFSAKVKASAWLLLSPLADADIPAEFIAVAP